LLHDVELDEEQTETEEPVFKRDSFFEPKHWAELDSLFNFLAITA
jgi:hypothetical protein